MRLVWIAPLAALALAGCGSVGAIDIPLTGGATGAPQDFNNLAAPTTPVEAGALPPATGTAGYDTGPVATPGTTLPPTTPLGTTTPGTTTTPVVPPATGTTTGTQTAAAGALGRTDLLGGWTVTAGTDSCQLFMTLTAWTGGYRASTRDCSSDLLMGVSAWNLDGSTVTLASADGTPLATLTQTTTGRFEGTVINGGAPIAFFR